MKRLFIILSLLIVSVATYADNASEARKILDKVSAVAGRKGGAEAQFSITTSKGVSQSGNIAIKGSKFCARTPQAIVWYNGKTQWTYLKSTEEVNISTPSQAQQQRMNPYTFLRLYKKGYKLSYKKVGGNYQIHMEAQNKNASMPELYVTVDSKYKPVKVRMRQGQQWTTIIISNFKAKDQADGLFQFNAKDYPKAEVIDLR